MSATQEVRFVDAECQHCHRNFPIPPLSDFSYGQFVFHGERGGVFGYSSGFECPSWEDIESRLLKISGLKDFNSRKTSPRLQEAIASCADKIEGQHLELIPVCPACRSRNLSYGDAKQLKARAIPTVAFTEFQSLSDLAKDQKLREFWNSTSPA